MKFILPLFLLLGLMGDKKIENRPDKGSLGKGQMPALAIDGKGIVHLTYGSGDSLLYSNSKDNGHTFTKPELIEVIEGLAANATRGPQITTTNMGLNVIAATDAGNIWSFIKIYGEVWKKGSLVNDIDSVNLEGFADVASDGKSQLFAVWLDTRYNKQNKLYGSSSSDGGRTWSANIKVYESPDSTICECCRVSAVMKGMNVYVMFRNQLYGKRDLHLVSSSDAGKSFGNAEKLGKGTWELKGCPMDGGDLAVTPEGTVQTVWRRESKIYLCEPGEPEIELGEGKSCTVENAHGMNVYAWVKNGNVICKFSAGNIIILGKGHSPALKAVGNNQVLCVWENEKQLYSSVIQIN